MHFFTFAIFAILMVVSFVLLFLFFDKKTEKYKYGKTDFLTHPTPPPPPPPPVIFQTWHTKDLPPLMKKNNELFKEMNPEFQYVLFDDDGCRQFIETHFDQSVLTTYDSLIPGAFKSDLWRYCVLYICGGIYLDIKYSCVGDFRMIDLFKEIENDPNKSFIVTETDPKYAYTGFLVSQKGNPLYKKCIEQIVENVKNKYYGNSPMAPTGPELFGQLLCNDDKSKSILFYYDDYFLKENENEKRLKYRKQGFIKNLLTGENILCHYLEYRIEQQKYSKTPYWMNLWAERKIYI